jgi:hypothetical protein
MPFFLVHGAEAVLPVEITHEAPRIAAYDEAASTEALQDDVDALDEARDVALARATPAYKRPPLLAGKMHLTSLYLPDILLSLLALSIELSEVAVLPERLPFPANRTASCRSACPGWPSRAPSAA